MGLRVSSVTIATQFVRKFVFGPFAQVPVCHVSQFFLITVRKFTNS